MYIVHVLCIQTGEPLQAHFFTKKKKKKFSLHLHWEQYMYSIVALRVLIFFVPVWRCLAAFIRLPSYLLQMLMSLWSSSGSHLPLFKLESSTLTHLSRHWVAVRLGIKHATMLHLVPWIFNASFNSCGWRKERFVIMVTLYQLPVYTMSCSMGQ